MKSKPPSDSDFCILHDFAARSPWERHSLLQNLNSPEEFSLPQNAVSYYVAGIFILVKEFTNLLLLSVGVLLVIIVLLVFAPCFGYSKYIPCSLMFNTKIHYYICSQLSCTKFSNTFGNLCLETLSLRTIWMCFLLLTVRIQKQSVMLLFQLYSMI